MPMPTEEQSEAPGRSLVEGHAETHCGSTIHYTARLPEHSSGTDSMSEVQPVLVLLHGYPQTRLMWRHLIKLLPDDIALFMPDLPGYGKSTPSTTGHDKRTIGMAILEALQKSPLCARRSSKHQPIMLIGHDRGARICHRLAVDFAHHPATMAPDSWGHALLTTYRLVGTALLDILPTVEQWRSFSKSTTAAGSYHWSFLANMPLAFDMIKAYGPEKYCKDLIARWHGQEPHGLYADDAVELYAAAFRNDDVVRASCEDYVAGADVDVEEQEADQEAGRKLDGNVLVIYSKKFLGKGGAVDVEGIWRNWMKDGASLTVEPIAGGAGHFIAEEAPAEVADVLMRVLGRCLRET